MKASDRQVSGSHYKSYAIQPAEFCQRNRLNWCESNVVKYVARHRDKKGAEDIRKAIHYLELLLEWEYPLECAAAAVADVKRDMGEWVPLETRSIITASQCPSCSRADCAAGQYPVAKDGGCEGYISALRENMLDAKQEAAIASKVDCADCDSATCSNAGFPMHMERCGGYKAKQEAPTVAVLPLDFTLPSIALKCTAEEAAGKFWSEREEWKAAEDDSFHELVERWDCLQALYTFAERGGDVEWYQDHVRVVMEDLARCHANGRDVMGARAACLNKNALRSYYAPEICAAIIASKGHRFQPLDEMGVI